MVDPERRQAALAATARRCKWAINPDNRHAYKRIYCNTHEEALAQATEQGAHLIAINDKAEQSGYLKSLEKKTIGLD